MGCFVGLSVCLSVCLCHVPNFWLMALRLSLTKNCKILNVVFAQLLDLIEILKGLTVPPCQHGVLWPLS